MESTSGDDSMADRRARRSDPQRVDLDAQAAGRSGHGGERVAERLVVGGAEPPGAVDRALHLDAERAAERLDEVRRRGVPDTTAMAVAGAGRATWRSGTSDVDDRPGSAWSAARSTAWSGVRVWTSRRPVPVAAAATTRAARASSASACSAAR